MALLKTAWANLQDGLGNRFSWSHVKAIFYNYAEKKLLSTKLDEMDALIDEKIAKAMMSNIQVNDQTKVPTSALAYSMSQEISQNAQEITQLNSKMESIITSSPTGGSALRVPSNGIGNCVIWSNSTEEANYGSVFGDYNDTLNTELLLHNGSLVLKITRANQTTEQKVIASIDS